MTDPLSHHDLHRLQEAQKELSAHIKARKRVLRPSTPRRIIGLCISIPMIAFGIIIVTRALELGYVLGPPIFGGGLLALAGAVWIYSDWFE